MKPLYSGHTQTSVQPSKIALCLLLTQNLQDRDCGQVSSALSQRCRHVLLIFVSVIAQGCRLNPGFKHRAAPWLLRSSKVTVAFSSV